MAECYNKIYLKKQKIIVNCGKCLNCISNKKKEYGLRMMHERETDKSLTSYFATLTYRDSDIPFNKAGFQTLSKEHIKSYIRKLKREVDKMHGKIKYFMGAEYGDQTARPHYHIIVLTNRPLLTQIKEYWEYGNVDAQISWSDKAISYTVGYANKKIGFKEFKNTQEPFHKFSRGLGETWIHEAIAKKKINEKKYYIQNQIITSKIPDFYKKKYRNFIMQLNKKMQIIGHKVKGHASLKLTPGIQRLLSQCKRKEIIEAFGVEYKEKYKYNIQITGKNVKHLILIINSPDYKYKYYNIETGEEITNLNTITEAEEKWITFKKEVSKNLKDKSWMKDYYYIKTKYGKWKNKNEKTDWYKIMLNEIELNEEFNQQTFEYHVSIFDEQVKEYVELKRRNLKDEAIKKWYMKEKNRNVINIA